MRQSPCRTRNPASDFAARPLPAMLRVVFIAAALLANGWRPVSAQVAEEPGATLVAAVQEAVTRGSIDALAPLLAAGYDPASIARFGSQWLESGTTRAVVKERDRVELRTGGHRLALEALVESGREARLGTWQLDVREEPAGWQITALTTLGSLDGLHRLELSATRQFQARNLHVTAEDFELVFSEGDVFTADVPGGATAVVLIGRGEMVFSPAPEVEKGQLRLYAGAPTLRTSFDGAFLRVNPADFDARVAEQALTPVPVQARDLRQAQELFRVMSANSFSLDLGDLSPEPWSLVPAPGDFLAEVRTRRFGTLTYTRVDKEPEDVSLFNRSRRRNISIYASRARLESRGPFFNEDDQQPFDVLEYHVDASLAPDRQWFDARARLRVRTRAESVASINLKLAGGLVVRSVTADTGRLLFLRVRNQDSLIVNLPGVVTRGTELTLAINYVGRVEPQSLEQELIGVDQIVQQDSPVIEPEPSLVFSNRSYWYPQTPVSDYAPASIRLTLPPGFTAVCTGDLASGSPVTLKGPGGEPRSLFVFAASQPIRYLACAVSRLVPSDSRTLPLPQDAAAQPETEATGARYKELKLAAFSTARQRGRGRDLLQRAHDITSVYAGILQDVPYPSFTLAVLEGNVPGGHSPAYFAALNQPLPTSPYTWRDDPASFDNYPEFFLAHEIAHQWWGQAVGWKNYHEQWLSEGFAQYFAAVYAERRRPGVFEGIIRSMNRWAVNTSDQGAVYLGYRLGHIKNDGRILRAVVYNKGAMVLHMLRRFVGDDVFFRGIRRFYDEHRFDKAGTDELQRVFEAESGLPLSRFFEEWIYRSDLPFVNVTSQVEGAGADQAALVRVEQKGKVFEFPLTVTLQLADGTLQDVVLHISDRVVERRVPFTGRLRGVVVNRDRAALIGEGGS